MCFNIVLFMTFLFNFSLFFDSYNFQEHLYTIVFI